VRWGALRGGKFAKGTAPTTSVVACSAPAAGSPWPPTVASRWRAPVRQLAPSPVSLAQPADGSHAYSTPAPEAVLATAGPRAIGSHLGSRGIKAATGVPARSGRAPSSRSGCRPMPQGVAPSSALYRVGACVRSAHTERCSAWVHGRCWALIGVMLCMPDAARVLARLALRTRRSWSATYHMAFSVSGRPGRSVMLGLDQLPRLLHCAGPRDNACTPRQARNGGYRRALSCVRRGMLLCTGSHITPSPVLQLRSSVFQEV